MKKILLFIFMLFGIVGCSCNNDVKVTLDKGENPVKSETSSYLYETFGLLTYELDNISEYDSKIEAKDSFVLFIYREGCFGCQKLSPSIKDYIEDNDGAVVYSMKIETIKANHTLYKDENISGTPWVVLVEKGSVAYKEIMPVENDTEAKAKDWFYKLMEKHVVWEE